MCPLPPLSANPWWSVCTRPAGAALPHTQDRGLRVRGAEPLRPQQEGSLPYYNGTGNAHTPCPCRQRQGQAGLLQPLHKICCPDGRAHACCPPAPRCSPVRTGPSKEAGRAQTRGAPHPPLRRPPPAPAPRMPARPFCAGHCRWRSSRGSSSRRPLGWSARAIAQQVRAGGHVFQDPGARARWLGEGEAEAVFACQGLCSRGCMGG